MLVAPEVPSGAQSFRRARAAQPANAVVSAHRDVTAWFRRDYTSTSAASAPDSAHAIARTISGSLLAGGGSRSDTLNCIDADGAGRPTGIAIGIEAMRAAGDAGMY